MISIIIATLNEQRNIKRLLISIQNQTYKDYEIIVVDNYSQDKTTVIAKKFTKHIYYFGPERSAQRNFGLKKSKGEYILFLDADMKLEKNVLSECFEKIKTPHTAALTIDERSGGKNFLAKIKALEKDIYKNTPIEAPRFFKKTYLLKIGGYDESLTAAEDWDLALRIKKFGNTAKINSKILHWENKTFFTDIKKKFYYAQNIQNYAKKHPLAFERQSSYKSRLGILLKKPGLILKNPIIFSGLLLLKGCQYLAYKIAQYKLLDNFLFTKRQMNAIFKNIKENLKRLNKDFKSNGLIFVLAKSLPTIIIFVAKHFVYKYLKRGNFKLNSLDYKYFYSLYNFTYNGERCVEIPIIKHYIDKTNGNILEIGNVLSHYFPANHDIVDKYEKGPHVINKDIINFHPKKLYDLVVSISTIEHIGWDEKVKDPKKIIYVIKNIKKLLKKEGIAVLTLAFAYNPYLDKILKTKRNQLFSAVYCLKRISKDNRWKQVDFEEIESCKFNSPYPFANAILIGVIENAKIKKLS